VSRVALTFDDGPSPWTAPILDLLAEHGAHATFFVVGEHVQTRPEIVGRALAEGHEIGNHTWSHPVLTQCDDERVRDELQRTNELLTELLGAPPARFRAPHFDRDERVDAIAAGLGLAHTAATVSPPDWHDRWSAPLTITFVAKQIDGGAIICLHDGAPPADGDVDRSATATAVAGLLERFAATGHSVVTATELLSAP
jgi:peptidoglycan/xylan/chitin deacetylase (PgdA/CDA1 family)